MLEFELHQIHLERLDRYYLPLPKLTRAQMDALESRLVGRGFSVSNQGERLRAEDASGVTTIARSGLAWSPSDMLDVLSPAIPDLLRFPREPAPTNPYLALKEVPGGFEAQIFPRMEGLRLWLELRRSGECGLTPDEKESISRLLRDAERVAECVTDYPTDGCSILQFGKRQYYRSILPAQEFILRLRTISSGSTKNSYLPRSSVLRVGAGSLPAFSFGADLGEWCYLEGPKSL